jgi:glycyl-tRNA synthetase
MQHVIAVGAQDISLLSLDHSPTRSGSYRLEFRTHSLLRNLHPNQITTLAFSSFTPPATAPTATSPQYLKLASTSMACTVIVHTIPLVPYTFNVGAKKKSTRYTLRPPGSTEGTEIGFSAVIAIMIVAFGAFFLQAWTEIRGGTPEFLGAKGWLSPKMHDYLARPYMFEDAIVLPTSIPTVESVRNRVVEEFDHAGNKLHEGAENLQGTRKRMPLREILRQHRPVAGDVAADPVIEDAELEFAAGTRRAVVVVRDHGEHLGAELHEDEEVAEEQGTRWEKLSRAERDKWKKRLVQAGEWAFEEGEAVLKGVFFGELAAVVAGAVG